MRLFQNKVRRMLFLLLIPLGMYVGYAALLYLLQDRVVYAPLPELVATPADVGLSYEEVSLTTSDGLALTAWFVPAAPARGVVLFCHGNAGNISHRLSSLQIWHGLGYSTLLFDYRGYGHSEGRPSEQGTYRDAAAAWDYLVHERQFTPDQIVLYGRSLGGAIATWLAQERTPRALILESTFTSVPDLAAGLYPYLPVRLLARFRYTTATYLDQVQRPVLIVHSRDDEMIPFDHGQRLYAAAGEPKAFLELWGTHNEGFLASGAHYREGLEHFLASLAP